MRLQQVASVLSLSSSPSTHAPVVGYIAPVKQCLRRATQLLEYLAPALLTYAAPFATATGGLNSLPVEPTVYSCTCGDIHCAGTSIARCTLPIVECIAPAPSVSLHLRLSRCTSRWHQQCLTPRQYRYLSTSRLRL